MNATRKEHLDTLEALVDRWSLPYVLSLLSEICYAKASHIAENWQDVGLAHVWERKGTRIQKLVTDKFIAFDGTLR